MAWCYGSLEEGRSHWLVELLKKNKVHEQILHYVKTHKFIPAFMFRNVECSQVITNVLKCSVNMNTFLCVVPVEKCLQNIQYN